jgi:GMP synthase (glutamine-hydrolysing)
MAHTVLVVKHVPWEGPHRIGDALVAAGFDLDVRSTIDGDSLPALDEVVGAVFMGGPMNVDEVDEFPGLAVEREWLQGAIAADLPVIGVCLGAQLIARALGAEVVPGTVPEIGWRPVTIHDAGDPLAGPLAPSTDVLHWHGDVFDLPPNSRLLASSDRTPVQGFRSRNAWGLLFHAEADLELAELWMAEPSMREEAERALGEVDAGRILSEAAEHDERIRATSAPAFDAFAAVVAAGV